MSHKLHVRDNKATEGEPKILERYSVDAHEIVAAEPDRYEIVGRAPPSSPGATSAVLDNDPPTEVARKVLAAAGVEPQTPDGQSEESADEDAHGIKTDAGAAKAKERGKPGPKPKDKPAQQAAPVPADEDETDE